MATRLMRADEVPKTPRDRVFRYSRLNAVLIVVACFAACAMVIVWRWPLPVLSYYISGVILLLLLLMQRFIKARFRASNIGSHYLEEARRQMRAHKRMGEGAMAQLADGDFFV